MRAIDRADKTLRSWAVSFAPTSSAALPIRRPRGSSRESRDIDDGARVRRHCDIRPPIALQERADADRVNPAGRERRRYVCHGRSGEPAYSCAPSAARSIHSGGSAETRSRRCRRSPKDPSAAVPGAGSLEAACHCRLASSDVRRSWPSDDRREQGRGGARCALSGPCAARIPGRRRRGAPRKSGARSLPRHSESGG